MNNQSKAMLYGLVAVLAWSTVATAFKLALRCMDHLQLLFLANVFSLVALGLVLVVQGRFGLLRGFGRRQLVMCAGLGLLNPFFYYLVLFKAYDLLPAQVAQPLNYTWALTLVWLASFVTVEFWSSPPGVISVQCRWTVDWVWLLPWAAL